jgi:DNA-binding XRE family transcriptional regulator
LRGTGKLLTKLLLAQTVNPDLAASEVRVNTSITHEEMAQRIRASRETVTRRLSQDLLATVETAERATRKPPPGNSTGKVDRTAKPSTGRAENQSLQPEQLTQSFGLSPADRDFALFLVVHPQLVGALEPGDDFPDAIDVHQIGTVGPPK